MKDSEPARVNKNKKLCVAQSGRVAALDAGGRRFESCHTDSLRSIQFSECFAPVFRTDY